MAMGDSVLSRLTFQGVNTYPTFTPDGRRIAFSSFADSTRDLFWKPADGSGRAEPLVRASGDEFEVTFQPNGPWMIYRTGNASTVADLGLRVRRVDGSGDSVFIDTGGAFERSPAFSPDGRMVAYVSNETGRDEVYVRPFPDDGSGAVWQASLNGGSEPVWANSGSELFYKATDLGMLVAARLRRTPTFAVVERRPLFNVINYLNNVWHQRYAVLPGDTTFVMLESSTNLNQVGTHIVLNWPHLLEQ